MKYQNDVIWLFLRNIKYPSLLFKTTYRIISCIIFSYAKLWWIYECLNRMRSTDSIHSYLISQCGKNCQNFVRTFSVNNFKCNLKGCYFPKLSYRWKSELFQNPVKHLNTPLIKVHLERLLEHLPSFL